MRAFTERQALSAMADLVNDGVEDEVKEFLYHTLLTGQRYTIAAMYL